ncbi:uncharacterized protein LOC135488158 [Lineus longissimus]|uniref:uncharacterized protein LOC135488158 n=1 Tax=Lineus longissimus TaxID=88925 RepID=UPI00315DBE06
MATGSSSRNHGSQACLVCLKDDGFQKVLTNCKHVFCCECLKKFLEALQDQEETFCCPTCEAPCPIYNGWLDDLLDYEGERGLNDEAAVVPQRATVNKTKSKTVSCHSCAFAKVLEIDAEYVCEECGNLHLCRDCTEVHGRNKATVDHVVISLKDKAEGSCRIHQKLINSYCSSCAQPCCHLCILFDHGDHNVKKIGEVFRTLVKDLAAVTEEQERRSGDLKKCGEQMRFLKGTEMTERKDILIRETEDHAERCIAHIVHQKEDLIKTIHSDYKVVTEVSGCLDRIPALVFLDTTVAKAKGILTKAETHPKDIRHLSAIKQDILDSGIKNEIDITSYWESYKKLYNNPVHFVTRDESNIDIGALEAKQPVTWDATQFKSVFEKSLVVDDDGEFIPCVTNLGFDYYAIAHPTVRGTPSSAIDIYQVPGELRQTFKEHVSPLYDMTATPGGQLAVLSDGTIEGACCVRLFDPEHGYIRSTKDFQIQSPLSFDINLRQEYVFLTNDEERKLTIFNEDGSLALTYVFDDATCFVKNACRTICSGVYIYVIGSNEVFAIFKQDEDTLALVTTSQGSMSSTYCLKDITVTAFDQITVISNYGSSCPYIGTYTLSDDTLSTVILRQVGLSASGPNTESRISVKDNYVVWSQGKTISVYKV